MKTRIGFYVMVLALACWTVTSTAQITFNPAATGSGGAGSVTFPLLAPLGAGAAPSYSFTGDPDTGIFSSGANTVNVAANGTVVAAVSSNGIQIANGSSFAFLSGVTIRQGANTPEGVVTAPVGSLFLRNNGGVDSTLYVKESGTGNTGWIAK